MEVVELLAEVDVESDAEEEAMVDSVVAVGEADDAEVVLAAVELTGVVDAVIEMVELLDDASVVVAMVEFPVEVVVVMVELLYVSEELVIVELFKNEAVEEAVVLDIVEFSYGAEELAILSSLNWAKRFADTCGATYL